MLGRQTDVVASCQAGLVTLAAAMVAPQIVHAHFFSGHLRGTSTGRYMRKIVPTLSALMLLTSLGSAAGAQGGAPTHAKADPGVARDKNGKVKRSSTAKEQFERQSGFPHGRPGYVVDHVVPLAKGGRDAPSNMQWQSKADAKAKDRVELGQHPKTPRSSVPRSSAPRLSTPRSTHSSSVVRGGFGSSSRSGHA
jgi:hypothetical protein